MGQNNSTNKSVSESVDKTNTTTTATNSEEKPKLKPCCVCLDTKRARDECVIQNGEEHCGDYIEAHKKCMRDLGFNI